MLYMSILWGLKDLMQGGCCVGGLPFAAFGGLIARQKGWMQRTQLYGPVAMQCLLLRPQPAAACQAPRSARTALSA